MNSTLVNILSRTHAVWLSLRDVWWDQPCSHYLLYVSLNSLILTFQIDIRPRKCILHRWYGEVDWSQHFHHLSPRLKARVDVMTCAEMSPSRRTNDTVCIYSFTLNKHICVLYIQNSQLRIFQVITSKPYFFTSLIIDYKVIVGIKAGTMNPPSRLAKKFKAYTSEFMYKANKRHCKAKFRVWWVLYLYLGTQVV